MLPVMLDDVQAARAVIAGRAYRTPIVRSAYLSDRLGADVHLKLECFQKTGSFKVRGVLNKMARLTDGERARGVVSVSAGNHAQAVAWAARDAGVSATVVMPATAVRSKLEATRGYGAEVIQTGDDLLETMRAVERERGLTFIPPFDDPSIVAGAGTLGDEIVDDVPGVALVVAGVGGGGLVSGTAVSVRGRRPGARVVGVEPAGACAMRLSLDRGAPQKLASVNTIADGLAAPWVGALNFEIVRALVHDVVLVNDDAIREAMWILIERCKVVAEPAAAAALAGLLTGVIEIPPPADGASRSAVVCVVSGGNVDRDRLRILA